MIKGFMSLELFPEEVRAWLKARRVPKKSGSAFSELFGADAGADLPDSAAAELSAKSLLRGDELRGADSMKRYMAEIGVNQLVTVEEEKQLADQIHNGTSAEAESARETLIQANLKLVVKIAHDFKGRGLPLQDLISEGNIGLMRAVEKFDPVKGAKFSSYAAWWIKQSMRRAISNQGPTVRIPIQTNSKLNRIRQARAILADKLGYDPSDAEIAQNLECSERSVSILRLADAKTFSIQDPIQTGEEGSYEQIIPDVNAVSPDKLLGTRDSYRQLRSSLKTLDEREREIIVMRFFRNMTLEDVSRVVKRTRERVRQIQNQALAKLRIMLADEAETINQ